MRSVAGSGYLTTCGNSLVVVEVKVLLSVVEDGLNLR